LIALMGGFHRLAVLRFALTDVCFWVQSGLALPGISLIA
jgi:hypothetical protein